MLNKLNSKRVRRERTTSIAETIKPYTVLSNDNWTCQICKCDTPKELRGTYDDNAPEVDHITPLALGGSHTYSNLQCLCRLCNILKGSMSNDSFIEWNQQHRGRAG